jgi:hypothetical protein
VDRDKISGGSEAFETTRDRILSPSPAGNDCLHLPKIPPTDQCLQFCQRFRSSDKDDLVHRRSSLKSGKRMRDYRFLAEKGEEFVESHAPAAAARDDNRAKHGLRLAATAAKQRPGFQS